MSDQEVPPTSELVAGKYRLVRLIGRGGMGSVWHAQHASLGTRVAIKFIESEYAGSQEARTRFDREARAAATIQSKHAIQIFDHGVTADGKPFIVMELLEGEPLDKRLERGPLSLEQTTRILQQVCRGLSRAHDRGVVHRDLKPENIFLAKTAEDDDEIAKVLDFGVAKIKAQDGELGPSTKTGAVLGTPFFMSPEQARGLRNVDHRTDVWSLGVIAYKCVIGDLPFDGESVGDLLVKICTAPLPVPSQVAPDRVPPAFDAWFFRALERDPERRFASAQELSDALAQAAGLPARGPVSHQRSEPDFGVVGYGATTPQPVPQPLSDRREVRVEGVTAAPLSSSQPVANVGGGRGAYVVAAALFGLLVAGIGTGVVYKLSRSKTEISASDRDRPPAAALTTSLGATGVQDAVGPHVEPTQGAAAHGPSTSPSSVASVRLNTSNTSNTLNTLPATSKPATKPAETPSKPATKPAEPAPTKTEPPALPPPTTTTPPTTAPTPSTPLRPSTPPPSTPLRPSTSPSTPTRPSTPLRPSTPPPAKPVDPGF